MTVVNYIDYNIDVQDRERLIGWEGLQDGDTGKPLNLGLWTDKQAQLFHASGSGATCLFEGSCDPRAKPSHADHANAVWETCTDSSGNNITTTTHTRKQMMESDFYVRPSVAGGTAASVNAFIHMKRNS